MNPNISTKLLSFLRRYLILFIIFLIGANVFFWLKHKNDKDYYQYILKIKCRGNYYDQLKTLTNRLADEHNWHDKNIFHLPKENLDRLIKIQESSYRNEDSYINELTVMYADTTDGEKIIHSLLSAIRNDSLLDKIYFNRLATIDNLMSKLNEDSANVESSFKRVIIEGHRSSLAQDVVITVPAFTETEYKRVNNSSRLIITNIIFLILGLVTAISIEELRR